MWTRHKEFAAPPPQEYGSLHLQLINKEGQQVSSMTRTSVDQVRDANIVYSALELTSALDRGVNITPEQLYKHLVGRDYIQQPVAALSVTPEMIGRFLSWMLPEDFSPDCGITFDARAYSEGRVTFWPTGTNLFTAEQAKAMLEHALGVTR